MPKTPTAKPSVTGLRSIPLLEGVALGALEELAGQCRWRRFTTEQRIISREAPDNDVYLIVSGKARVTAFSASGREVTFGDLRAGDWFGDFAAIDGLSRSADVVALEDTLVAAMSPALFRRMLSEHPVVADRMMRRLV